MDSQQDHLGKKPSAGNNERSSGFIFRHYYGGLSQSPRNNPLPYFSYALHVMWRIFVASLYVAIALCLVTGLTGIYALVKANSNEMPILAFFTILYKTALGQQILPAEKIVLEQFVNASVYAFTILVTIMSAVFLVEARRKLKNSIKRELPYVAKEIIAKPSEVHKHAVPIMKNLYANASGIKVISGDYDWIIKNNEICSIVIKLVKQSKAELYSYKTKEVVERAWQSETRALAGGGEKHIAESDLQIVLQAIKYGASGKYKASLIEYTGGSEALVFLSQPYDEDDYRDGETKKYAVLEYRADARSKTVIDMAKFVFAHNKGL